MRRVAVWTAVFIVSGLTAACPVYDDDYCSFDMDCAPGLLCNVQTGMCYGLDVTCSDPDGCYTNETCGVDGYCHVGDCSFHGCVSGFVCLGGETGYRCVSERTQDGGAGAGGAAGSDGRGQSAGGGVGSSDSSNEAGATSSSGAAGAP